MEQASLNAHKETDLTALQDSGKGSGWAEVLQEWKRRLSNRKKHINVPSGEKGFQKQSRPYNLCPKLYNDGCHHLLLTLPRQNFKTFMKLPKDYEAMYGLMWELAINEGKSKNITMKRLKGTQTHT